MAEPWPGDFGVELVWQRDARPLTLVVLFPTDPDSINVVQVTTWAESQGIGVFRPAKK